MGQVSVIIICSGEGGAMGQVSVTIIPPLCHIYSFTHSFIHPFNHPPTNATWSWKLTASLANNYKRTPQCPVGIFQVTNTLPTPSGKKRDAECSPRMLAPTEQAIWLHTPQNHNMNLHSYEKPQISHNYKLQKVYILLTAWQCCHLTDMLNRYFHNPLLSVHHT